MSAKEKLWSEFVSLKYRDNFKSDSAVGNIENENQN